jgi:hypothetical protein
MKRVRIECWQVRCQRASQHNSAIRRMPPKAKEDAEIDNKYIKFGRVKSSLKMVTLLAFLYMKAYDFVARESWDFLMLERARCSTSWYVNMFSLVGPHSSLLTDRDECLGRELPILHN